MKDETENMTAQQSLDIITAMIMQAKGNVQRNNFYFLLWGWVVAIANIGMYTLERIGYEHPYIVWAITIPAWIYTLYKVFKTGKVQTTVTHFDRISGWLWISFGITIFCVVIFGGKINYQINPVILVMSAIPTVVSGIILKFRPLIVGGVSFWIFGIVAFLVSADIQPLIGASAIISGYLIPGYLLKRQHI
jgi:hypothetical protein